MADVIYNYPKSSCNCYKCTDKTYKNPVGRPTNMSVTDCKFPPYYECYDRTQPFREDVEPRYKHGFHDLNPLAMQQKYAKDFNAVSCPNDQQCKKVYASPDPRLVSSFHNGQVLTLDRPPISVDMKLSKIPTDKGLNGYGQNYKGYSDVNAGQITYYVDETFVDPFISPLYSIPAKAYGFMYQDPMGAMKPQYEREPLKCNNPLNTKNQNYFGGLSWIQDSTEHREDIMSRAMRKYNQERYEPRWYGYGKQ